MNVKVKPSEIFGEIRPLSSKSVAHRSLICAFLSGEETQLVGNFELDDINATISALSVIGGEFEKNEGGILFKKTQLKNGYKVNAFESGSTLRFLIPLISAMGIETEIVGSKRLANRPIAPLLSVLKENGANFSGESLPIKTSGKLKSGHYKISGNISSQFITGLLFALSILDGESIIEIEGELVSKDYVEITLNVLNDFGVKVERKDNGFRVKSSKYVSPKNYYVEGDWSSACFLLAGGAILGNVSLKGLKVNSKQGDKIILQVLKEMGAKVKVEKEIVSVGKSQLKAITFDAENYPDVVPILSVLMANAQGKSVIKNVSRLVDKESDRLYETIKMLNDFSIKAEYKDNQIIIYGGKPKGTIYSSPNDHRMAMSATVLALASCGESQILNAECVNKSYPCFFEHIKKLGGNISV